jgi:hypothetical protein
LKTPKQNWDKANNEHVNNHQRARAKKAIESAQFPCEDCQKTFANKTELEKDQESEVAYKSKRDAARAALLTCGGCKKVFSQMANSERHHAGNSCEASLDMSCSTCGRVVKNKGDLRWHIATVV